MSEWSPDYFTLAVWRKYVPLCMSLLSLVFMQKFSTASKYAALLMDGDQGDDADGSLDWEEEESGAVGTNQISRYSEVTALKDLLPNSCPTSKVKSENHIPQPHSSLMDCT